MESLLRLPFNKKPSTLLHIDLNSCFATIEQQARPPLRGKPIAVAAYTTDSGCIVAPSIEAKRYGVKTGMRVKDGRLLCPQLVILPPDPNKYRHIHRLLKRLLLSYTDAVTPKSIDEFVLNLEGSPAFGRGMHSIACEIKLRIKSEVGDYLTVSIGIGPNRWLAKMGAGLHKPDGLDEINHANFEEIYSALSLRDLSGIAERNTARLNSQGVFTVMDFYNAPEAKLRRAFQSVLGYYWHTRLHGWEIDDVLFDRKSYGNSYSLPDARRTPEELGPILSKLVEKMATRLRRGGYYARGVHVALMYRDHAFYHRGVTVPKILFAARDIYKEAFLILCRSLYKGYVRNLAVSCFDLIPSSVLQLELFDDVDRKERLTRAVDTINERWGEYVITPARMLGTEDKVPDRISFGGIKELEDYIID